MKWREAHDIAKKVSRACNWDGKDISLVYLEALTDANFHTLRKKIAKLVNKELRCKLRIAG